MTVGERIKYLREKNNMTQTDVAKRIGIATQTIFKYEKNIVTNIPLGNIEKLAAIFDVTPSYLAGWSDNITNINSNYIGARSPLNQQMGEIEFTLYGEMRDLSDEEKQDILDYARFKKQQKAALGSRQYTIPVTIAAESGEKLEGVAAPDEADELSAFEEYKNN